MPKARYDTDELIQVPKFAEENGFYTTAERSKNMSKIRGKDTKPEVALRKAVWQLGYRYRKNHKKLAGKPDLAFTRQKVAVFVDGEFWHGHNWEEKKHRIKSNQAFWIPKIERNMQRDRQNTQLLEQQGWTVLRFWEQDLKKDLGGCLKILCPLLGQPPVPKTLP